MKFYQSFVKVNGMEEGCKYPLVFVKLKPKIMSSSKIDVALTIDFELLKAQKRVLLEISGKLVDEEQHAIEGLLGLIDKIQDTAVDEYGYDRDLVFNLSDEESDEPKMSYEDALKIIAKHDEG
jgi:hypothetical protein